MAYSSDYKMPSLPNSMATIPNLLPKVSGSTCTSFAVRVGLIMKRIKKIDGESCRLSILFMNFQRRQQKENDRVLRTGYRTLKTQGIMSIDLH